MQQTASSIQSKGNKGLPLIIVIIVIAIVVIAVIWYLQQPKKIEPAPAAPAAVGAPTTPVGPVEPPAGETIKSPDLGTEVFKKASNPVSEKLPDTLAPVANPIENLYKNPFE